MFRNYAVTALRNLTRSKLHTSIIIAGLGIGFATAIFISLFVRDELSYDSWLPLNERTYLLRTVLSTTGHSMEIVDRAPSYFGPMMKLDFTEIEAAARMTPGRASLRTARIENNEDIYWADQNLFDVLRLPVVAGDLRTALQNPAGVVLSRRMARKYFGKDDPVGEAISFDREHAMTVTAVFEDLPSNTHMRFDILASGRAAFSNLTQFDSHPPDFLVNCLTYLRLSAGASASQLEGAMPAFLQRHHLPRVETPGFHPRMLLTPITDMHLAPSTDPFTKPHGRTGTVWALGTIGALAVLMASINFVNLMTARGAQRAKEIGIRKTVGAARRDLVCQFLGEALLYVALGGALAAAIVELFLPGLNALADRTIVFDWWSHGTFFAAFLGFLLLIGILAGAYPALVLSAFRPVSVVKGAMIPANGADAVRRGLVILQFATLAGLIIATAVIYEQTQFALRDGMRLDKDQVYLIRSNCKDAFRDEVAGLPGVKGAVCSSAIALNFGNLGGPIKLPDGTRVTAFRGEVDFGFFELYGLRPIAGRFFSRDRGSDALPEDADKPMAAPLVINEAAVRTFNFANAEAAIGQTVSVERYRQQTGVSQIIGVVPDFSLESVRGKVAPTIYFINQNASGFLSVKLSGRDIPETLDAIDRLWNKSERPGPVNRLFLDQYIQGIYRDMKQQELLLGAFTAVAIFIACTGLFGLAAHAATARTKEIGIRKAMGASKGDILRLLAWEFTKPVLVANLIAWPIAYYVMDRWLRGFAYHIDLRPWMFAASGALALVIAVLTVLFHALLIARARPVEALRYE